MYEMATVDPLKKIIVAHFHSPIPGREAWIAFQIIAHAFAVVNDCVVPRISKVNDKEYRIEVLTKNHRQESLLDPFVDNWKPRSARKKEAFQKFLQEKAEELRKEDDKPEPTNLLPTDPDMWNR